MYEFTLPGDKIVYALTRPEDIILIDSAIEISKKISNTETWFRNFWAVYFDRGMALAQQHLLLINHHLRRIGLQTIELKGSRPDDYTAMRGLDKAKERLVIFQDMTSSTITERAIQVENSRRVVAQYLIYTPPEKLQPVESRFTPVEQVRRRQAVALAETTPAPKEIPALPDSKYRVVLAFDDLQDVHFTAMDLVTRYNLTLTVSDAGRNYILTKTG